METELAQANNDPEALKQRLQKLEEYEFRLKEQELELLRKQYASYKQNPLASFVPSPKQYKFLEAAGTPRRGVFAGNRFGKSTIGTVEDICYCIGYRPFFPKEHPLRTRGIPQDRGVKILVLVEDWDKAREIFTEQSHDESQRGKIWQFVNPDDVSGVSRNRQNGVIDRIFFSTTYRGLPRNSLIMFDTVRSFKNNPRSAESSNWDIIHVDEPIPREMWDAHSRGLIDSGGQAWFLLTALEEPWIYNMFTDAKAEDKKYWSIMAETDDNPTLSEEAIEMYFDGLTPEEIECRRRGIPRAFGKMVYLQYIDTDKQFIEKPDSWRASNDPPPEYTIHFALDLHPQTPHAVLFAAVSPFNQIYLYYEIFEKLKIADLAKQVLEHIEGRKWVPPICDPIAWIENPSTGLCWADELQSYGLPVMKSSKNKSEGIVRTRDLLATRPPRIFVLKDVMKRTIFEFKSYVYNKENKPVDKDDHMMENLYRLVINQLVFVPDDGYDSPDPVPDLEIVGDRNL